MKAHSSSSSGPGLRDDRVGDRDLADVVQLGGEQDVFELLAVEAELAADGAGEVGDAAEMALEAGMALGEGAQQHVACSGGAAVALPDSWARTCAGRRSAAPRPESAASPGMATAP